MLTALTRAGAAVSLAQRAAAACAPLWAARASAPAAPTRTLTASAVVRGMEEFFTASGAGGAGTGRAWAAAELRLKSFGDLHALWFLCLKERNRLLTERLYFAQVGQAAPDGNALTKVRLTMARIKVVLGERQRAESEAQADAARRARLSPTELSKKDAAQAVIAALAPADASSAAAAAGKRGRAGDEVCSPTISCSSLCLRKLAVAHFFFFFTCPVTFSCPCSLSYAGHCYLQALWAQVHRAGECGAGEAHAPAEAASIQDSAPLCQPGKADGRRRRRARCY